LQEQKASKKKPAFVVQLAELAQVSPATASRVIRGHQTVTPAMRDRVYDAARKLGVELGERVHRRSNAIAFVIANRETLNSFQSRVLWGAEAYCTSQHRRLRFLSFQYSSTTPPKDLALPIALNERSSVRGLILAGTNSANMLTALKEKGFTFAVLGNNVIGQWDDSEFDVLYSDDVQGAYDLTRHLVSRGHKDIWYFGDTELPWHARCARGYRRAMTEAAFQPRLSEIHSEGYQMGYMATRSLLSRKEPFTAVFAGSDQIARGIYEALRQAGLRVPNDISVAAFNDTEAPLSDPPLTSVREFPEELGRHLVEFVLRRMREPGRSAQHLSIPTRMIMRESVKPLVKTF
jgi:LacI family transcriptional regulator